MHKGLKDEAANTWRRYMASQNFSGTTEITAEGIKKHFKNTEPTDAIFELVWNGFDAKANVVTVSVDYQELGSPSRVSVEDDGEGIDFNNYEENFGRFNDSAKKDDVGQHGSHGRGRLAFHKLAQKAAWYTKTADGEAVILVNGDDVKNFDGRALEPADYHGRVTSSDTGTVVELQNIIENLPDHDDLIRLFSDEFGWYLALNSGKRLIVNGDEVAVPSHELYEDMVSGEEATFDVKIYRWDDRPTSEKSYTYLINSAGRTVHRQLSTLNNKSNFFTSVLIQSPWADTFSQEGGLFSQRNPDCEEWRLISRKVAAISKRIYEDFLRRFVDSELDKFIDDGVFPEYPGLPQDYAKWRHENTKEIVRAIYTADPAVFTSLSKKQRKILVRLLDRISVSSENEALFDVLQGVLDLDPGSVHVLAAQLKRTTLENIVSTIELLQRRQHVVQELRRLMNDHYHEVLETPDLQGIIENNTWLFGPQYETLGAEEDTFTKITKSLRDQVREIDVVGDADIEGVATVEGANRQPDLFLARKMATFDSLGNRYFRCIVVEIKRPSISLGVKHLRQLDDYAGIIKKYAEFSSDRIHFELILIGRKISEADTEIASRMTQLLPRGEIGLVTQDPRMKRYVLNWYTLLDGFELANEALLERLKLKRDEITNVSKDELVKDLQDNHAWMERGDLAVRLDV